MAQVNVNLAFSADTGKAKTQIMELQSLLSKIAYTSATGGTDKLQADLHAASEAAKELQFHLNNAFNVSTGNFDLSMLDRSLKTSGTNIQKLSMNLLNAGATGQQAFVKLAQSISLADQPMFRISNRMKEFAVTMKNTVKWQLSSSMLHGFMGAMQSAYGYAQDLNESLNNIRIVTGYNIDKMAQFAEQANKAAKALSTTTTDYTDASLIYFQQGLSDAEVQGRTDTTIKLANVTGQSVEETANQMTAIWNNFDDGSKSLDYYADVITALGAATASSSKEISEGLNKFSAIAESVGLSYEYASAALATVTATTRQSADIVGNSFKTLFARIQGLNLGETLDDGTTLNKYSEALFKVGINVKDQSGQLKDMNTILDEMGSKWNTLGKDQQVALAQTVGGVRQYTQLIALMDNWNYFQQNLGVATGAEGTLNKQAEIYAESWEAAEKRVQAAAEGIYQSLLDDKFFISLNNGFANLLGGLDAFIDGAGGVKTVLTGISSVIITSFANKIPEALDTFRYNLEIVTKGSQAAYDRIQKDMNTATQDAFTKFNTSMGNFGIQKDSAIGFAIEQANELTAARNKLALISDKMSTAEKQSAEIQLNLIKAQQDEVVSIREKNEQLQESIRLQQEQIRHSQTIDNSRNKTLKSSEDMSNMYLSYNDTLIELEEQRNRLIDTINQRSARGQDTARQEDNLTRVNAEIEQYEALSYAALGFSDNYKAAMQVLNTTNNTIGQELFNIFSQENFDTALKYPIRFAEELGIAFDQIEETLTDINLDFDDKLNLKTVKDQIKALQSTIPEIIQSATGLDNAFNRVFTANDADELEQAFLALRLSINNCTLEGTDFQRVLEGLYGRPITQISADMQKYAQGTEQATQKTAALKKLLEEFKPEHTVRISEAMGSLAGLMGNVVTIGNSLKSMLQSLGDPDLSGWEKFSAVLTGLSVLIPTVLSSLQAAATINEFLSKSYGKSAIAIGIDTAAKTISTKVTTALGIANTGLVASMGPLLVIIAAVAAAIWIAVKAFKFLKWVFDSIKNASPEGKLEATKETTEAMAVAAQDAATAYQNLLDTISGYDSAVEALENLEVGTQEFTNALITANEKAWELIDAYGLIQDQDWYYGKNGEIIINDEAKNRITKEANDIREDAVIAHSAAQVQEKEAAYNVSRSNAGMVGYDIQQGYLDQNVLYDALGLTDGSFKHTKDAIQQWQEEGIFNADVADKIAQSLYGVDWLDLDSSQFEYINNNIFKYLDEIETMFRDFSQYNSVKENQFDKQVSTVMSDEEAYQKTSWKGAVNDYLESSFESAKQEALVDYEGKTDDQISAAYEDYLKKTYIEEDSKYYRKDASGKKTGEAVEGLTGLSPEAQKDILATVDAWQVLEDKGVEMAQSFNGIANNMTDSEKDVADALLNGDLSSLTEEQVEAFKTGELSLEEAIGSSNYQQLSTLLDENFIQKLEDKFKEAINNWQPPEFDLESWKADYAKKMDIIKDLETGDEISAEDYALLEEEYQQYFQVQADGTAILIAKAEELKAAAQGIEISELEDDIRTKQDTINRMNEANIVTDTGRTLDFNAAHNAATQGTLHETWEEAYINAVNEALGTTYETSQQAAEGYNNYIDSLNQSQNTLASTAEDLDQLNEMLSTGKIDRDEYDANFKGTLVKDAAKHDLDYEEVLDYAESLRELNKELADNEQLSEEIALAEKKQAKGADDLIDNYKDYVKILKKAKLDDTIKNTEQYSKTIKALQKDLSLLTGYSEEIFTDEFVNSDEVQKALLDISNGIDGATERLKVLAAAQEIKIKTGIEIDQVALEALQAEITNLNNQDIEIGATIDEAPALDSLVNLLQQAGYTTSQIQDLFNNLGWQPEISYEEVQVKDLSKHESGGYVEVVEGNPYEGYTVVSKPVSAFSAMDQEEWVKVPKIGSKSTGGGGYKKVDPIGNSSSKTPSSGGGGGGGGGSAPKHAEKKNDSDKERYHTLQNQLEDLKSEYDSISEAADQAFGKEKLEAIDDEINKTDELINKQEEYLDAISQNLPIDKAVMEAYYNNVIGGPAIEFDEKGNISNYDAIQDAMFNKYNQMTSLDEDSEEWQAFEKKYEQLEKYIEQYEETYDLLRDEEAEYQDLLRQRIDLQLEKVQYSVEIQLDIPENEIAIIEYQLGKIEDDAFKSAEAIGLLTKKAENVYDQIQVNKQGLNDLLELSLSTQEIIQLMNGDMSVLEGKTFTEDQIDAIKEYRDNLLDLNEEFDDIRENIEEQVMEVFDAWNEKLEQGVDKLEHYGDVLESYKNIIDIVGKDTLGLSDTFMATLNQSSIDNAINKVTATKKSYEAMIDAQSQAEQALEEAKARNDEASIKMWEENLQSITEEAQSAREEMLSAWEDALDGIAEQFEATVERVVDIFNKEIYTLGGLEGLSEDFSRQQENADIMLDDYQKIYELSKLSRDINKSIDDTDSISGKQKLKKLLEQINKLQEDGVEMSQYDLEYMQKTYDLRMAEIELEEAQRAKNTVRLRKDNEGNWSYVYTQNMDAVDTAQQKYEDALYAMQDVSSNYIDEMSEKLISTSQEMEEALAAIRIQDYANIDDYYAEVQRVQKQYEDELAVQQKELQKAIDNNKILYDEDWTNYHNATGYKISDTENFATTFRDTLLGSLMGSEEDTANFTDVVSSAVNTLTQGLMQGAEVYYANLQDAMNAAGTSTEDFAKDFEEKIKEIEDKSEESTNKIKDLAKDMSSSLKDITDSVTTWQETYGEVMQQIINSNLDVINSFNDMLEALSIDKNSITVKYDILSDDTKKPEQYASGGYTGKWGNYGKLAILDEKELILNKDDTVNFLDALGIAKQIIDTIDLNALQASYGFGNLVPATINENNSQTIEQDVHITAEFPNATDHNEIEQAFETLINKASQYANRK